MLGHSVVDFKFYIQNGSRYVRHNLNLCTLYMPLYVPLHMALNMWHNDDASSQHITNLI